MTDDRINRDDCIAAIEAAPNADDAIALIRALPAADAGALGALGAVAMREACLDVYVKGDWDWFSDAHDAMAEIPVPTHAAQLAAALRLPEVAALRTALKEFLRLQKSITNDVKSAHSGRGAGASEWMREDDRDFSRDIDAAFGASISAIAALEARHDQD